LALGLYGDLDVSTLDELPPGRQKIRTVLARESEAMKLVQEEIAQGRQAYIVYPLIDETKSKRIAEENEESGEENLLPALDLEALGIQKLKAAEQEFQKHKAKTFKNHRVALLHGRMNRTEKEKVMIDFKDGKYDVLMATTVIEVGIDVPNAAVMVIENAERFGLSTLHQLRGRVGRGKALSQCVLVGQPKTEQAQRRLDIILKSGNGFEIAEEDMKLRGPGEIFGVSQHGLPPFKIADFNRDLPILRTAQKATRSLVEKDPGLSHSDLATLRQVLRSKFSKSWQMSTIA
jgi:ATP-dependent DNA helicase RecG